MIMIVIMMPADYTATSSKMSRQAKEAPSDMSGTQAYSRLDRTRAILGKWWPASVVSLLGVEIEK